MQIKITNLRLRTIIGMNDWERTQRQDVIINVLLDFDGTRVAQSDNIADTINYKSITKRILAEVESSEFYMLEKLASHVLNLVMEDPNVASARVEVDKPGALRFADSVSVATFQERP